MKPEPGGHNPCVLVRFDDDRPPHDDASGRSALLAGLLFALCWLGLVIAAAHFAA